MLKILKAFIFCLSILLLFGSPSHAQAPTPTAQGEISAAGFYEVLPGDTLYGISNRFGVSVSALMSANILAASDNLFVGQTLSIPGLQGPEQAAPHVATHAGTASRSRSHTVIAGDTLYSIAREQGVEVTELASLNTISDPSQLLVGQVLVLPGGQSANEEVPTPEPSERRHEVLAGQTLFSIARQYQIEVTSLAFANAISDPAQLRVGQVLIVPSAPVGVLASTSQKPSIVTLPKVKQDTTSATAQSGVRNTPTPTTIRDPAHAEVIISTAPATPIMLPNPPPRRGSKFHWPARGKILTRFGRQNNGQIADGIEIKVDSGAAVMAAEDGVVAFAGTGVSGYGYLVLIKHADDYYTAYGQNSQVAVSRGDMVQRGQLIARAGNPTIGVNGRLHFEVRYRENPVNPIAYMVN